MAPRPLTELLGAVCRVRDVRVGEVVAVVLDASGERVIGLGIRSAGDVQRFLPWVACEFDERGVSVRSAFLLVDDGASYARVGARKISEAEELADLRFDVSGRLLRVEEAVSTQDVVGIRPA